MCIIICDLDTFKYIVLLISYYKYASLLYILLIINHIYNTIEV